MFDEPALLLERTLHNLEVLAELFSEEVAERRRFTAELSPVDMQCLRAQAAIQTLLPTLQAAGDAWREQIGMQPRMRPGCVNCED